jgi:transposase
MTKVERDKRRQRIRSVFRETGSIKETVRRLSLSRRVVRLALGGQEGKPRVRACPVARKSKLDPYREVIRRLVVEDEFSATLVLEQLRKLGYQGGYSILKAYVRSVRPRSALKVTTRLEHPPGAEGQVDWSPYTVSLGGETTVVHAFSLVLPFSRYVVIRMARDTSLETLLALHEEAFTELGGYPSVMSYDNMTTVGRHCGKDEIWMNPKYEAYRQECGFEVHLIDPGCPTQHGTVERTFLYLENHFLKQHRYSFESFEQLEEAVKQWSHGVANQRIHGTTRERPCSRFQRERGLLLPLRSLVSESVRSYSRLVGTDFCVALNTNRYSVPPRYVGLPATVMVSGERVSIRVNGEVVSEHALVQGEYQRQVLPAHEESFRKSSRSVKILEQVFLRLGAVGEDYYQGLKVSRGRGAIFHMSRILKLCDRYGLESVSGAMAHAARYGNYSADALVKVLSGRALVPKTSSTAPTPPPPPDRIKRWLEGLDVEVGDLRQYDRVLDELDERSKLSFPMGIGPDDSGENPNG